MNVKAEHKFKVLFQCVSANGERIQMESLELQKGRLDCHVYVTVCMSIAACTNV